MKAKLFALETSGVWSLPTTSRVLCSDGEREREREKRMERTNDIVEKQIFCLHSLGSPAIQARANYLYPNRAQRQEHLPSEQQILGLGCKGCLEKKIKLREC